MTHALSRFSRHLLAALASLTVAAPRGALAGTPPATATPVKHPGCFLLMNLSTGEVTRNDAKRCAERLSPVSTFKIPHALIALETGVVTDAKAVRKWDGKKRAVSAWNQDQTLVSAVRESAVWFFQETAVEIGRERMQEWLRRFEYGNQDSSGEPTLFWLDGTLRISPEEQMEFLARLYRGELPVSERAREEVKRILVMTPDTVTPRTKRLAGPWPSGAVVSAKTGTSHPLPEGEVSWLVGHVESPKGRYVFVSAVTGRKLEGPVALHAAVDALRALQVL
jgi:beta-lactamase class D